MNRFTNLYKDTVEDGRDEGADGSGEQDLSDYGMEKELDWEMHRLY